MGNPFVHVDLMSTDTERTKSFYGKLFDWNLEDMPMPAGAYTMIKVGSGNRRRHQAKPHFRRVLQREFGARP